VPHSVAWGSPTRMDWSWALIWVLASGHLAPGGSAHHSASSTSWTVWGSKPIISGGLGLKPIFGSWVVRPGGVTILQPVTGSFVSKPITGGSWGSNKPINTGTRPTGAGSRPQVGLELNSKWGPMAGTSAYKWSHSRPGSSSYQSVNFSYKMKPKPHPPPNKPPTVVTTNPPPTPPPTRPPQPTLPPYKPPTQPRPTTPSSQPPPTTPPSTTAPSLPDFLLPSPLLPLEDIDLPSGGAPTVLRPSSKLSPSVPSRTPQSPLSPPCRSGVAPPCLPPTLSILLP